MAYTCHHGVYICRRANAKITTSEAMCLLLWQSFDSVCLLPLCDMYIKVVSSSSFLQKPQLHLQDLVFTLDYQPSRALFDLISYCCLASPHILIAVPCCRGIHLLDTVAPNVTTTTTAKCRIPSTGGYSSQRVSDYTSYHSGFYSSCSPCRCSRSGSSRNAYFPGL